MENRSTARDWQTRIRLWAAIVLGFFQLLSMAYYTAGLVSLDAMELVLAIEGPALVLFPLFSVALFAHMLLGLYKLYRRNTLKMPAWEAAQILLGLCLPFFLLSTNIALSLMDLKFGLPGSNLDELALAHPELLARILGMTLIIGAHAQIGTHAVLRMRPWYPKLRLGIVLFFVVVPLLAVAGYANASMHLPAGYHALTDEQLSFLRWTDLGVSGIILALYGMLFVVRRWRIQEQEKNQSVRIEYPDGDAVMVMPATTVLEASRIGGKPHASICGGRGRCTTCRIRVEAGMENLSPVGEREHKALLRIGAGEGIRLACQAEGLGGPVKVVPLVPPDATSSTARRETKDTVGRDVALAVMFVDLRGFTSLSEQKFPYDVVYILNSFYQAMGLVIEGNRGHVDKFLGDGILAYFGLDRDPRDGCHEAIQAARDMARDLEVVNQKLKDVLPQGLSLGIGLHYGDVVLGELGFGDKKHLTIIGDTVNTASRLEALNKRAGTQLIVSTGVAARAGLDLSHLPIAKVAPRGKEEVLRVYVVKDILKDLGYSEGV